MVIIIALNFIFFCIISGEASGDVTAPPSLGLPEAEREAAYLALEAINPEVDWRTLYSDDLCLYGPHGIACDAFEDVAGSPTTTLHISELNFGFVSDFSANPSCSPNATFPVFFNFPFLRKIFFFQCFTGSEKIEIPSSFWNLSELMEELVVVGNPALSGRIGSAIGRLRRLRRLIISGSRISGEIPDGVGNLENLVQLTLSYNRLRGEIPVALLRCRRLKILDLSGNRIAGTLPSGIREMEELIKLDLGFNRISGPIPAEISRLGRLELLDLSNNRFSNGVPPALGEMTSLKEIYLSGNPLGGELTEEIWKNLTSLTALAISKSDLTGGIPRSIGEFLSNLTYLALDNNSLDGELPAQLANLESKTAEINLENNAFQGQIPFSSVFVAKAGDNLKLRGNPKLCVGEDIVGPTTTEVSRSRPLAYLPLCNKTRILAGEDVVLRLSTAVSTKLSPAALQSLAALLLLLF